MSKKYSINIESEAFNDIQEAINYYNRCKPGLGKKFLETVKKTNRPIGKIPPVFCYSL